MTSEETLVYKIFGATAQILEISLEPNKTLIADGGLLLYLDEEISHETLPDDGYEMSKLQNDEKSTELDSFPDELEEEGGKLDLMPDVVNLPPKPAPKDDDEESEGSFLEKLWKATRKTIVNIGQKIQDSTIKKTKSLKLRRRHPPLAGFLKSHRLYKRWNVSLNLSLNPSFLGFLLTCTTQANIYAK